MKSVFKKSIAALLLAGSLTPHIFAAQQAPEIETTADVAQTETSVQATVEKTKLQKAANIGGAFVRGLARGLAGGCATNFLFLLGASKPDHIANFFVDNGQVRLISEALVGPLDDTHAATVTEDITAAFTRAVLVYTKTVKSGYVPTRANVRNFLMVVADQIIKGLDTRAAHGVKKYALLAAIGITESINFSKLKKFSKSPSAKQLSKTFRPLVGAAAICRTLLVDKIIDARVAAGKCSNAHEIKKTRTILNGTLGVALDLGANLLNSAIVKKLFPSNVGGARGTGGNNFGGGTHARGFNTGSPTNDPRNYQNFAPYGFQKTRSIVNITGRGNTSVILKSDRVIRGEQHYWWNDTTNMWQLAEWN